MTASTLPQDRYQSYVGMQVNTVQSTEEKNLECLKRDGYFIVESVFGEDDLKQMRKGIDAIWDAQLKQWGADFLQKKGEYGQVRCMMERDPYFLSLIRHPALFSYVAKIIGPTAILHLQNGIVLHPSKDHNQARFHKDFPKDFISTKLLSLNILIAIDPFTKETGGTWIVPGTHLFDEVPSQAYMESKAIQVEAPPGTIIVFDSFLWHRGGSNKTNNVRRAINQQYTRPFIKQQLDYPTIMKGKIDPESELAQTLGCWSVVSRSLEEFRVADPAKRTYRAGQG